MTKPASSLWTGREIEIIVTDYLDMLKSELSGEKFIKAEHNRALQMFLNRSRGSIEFKRRNISAVLSAFGLPFVEGYRPATHYQRDLFEAVEAQLGSGKLYNWLAGEKTPGPSPSKALVYEPPPSLTSKEPQIDDPAVRRIIRKFDPAKRDARARALGEAGEAFLFQAERFRLSESGREDLAAKVRWVAKEDGDGAGFDILSFSASGEERWLEAKTTNGPSTTPFWISETELRVSEQHRCLFRLVRIYNFSRKPAAYRLKPPLTDHVRLTPTEYRADF